MLIHQRACIDIIFFHTLHVVQLPSNNTQKILDLGPQFNKALSNLNTPLDRSRFCPFFFTSRVWRKIASNSKHITNFFFFCFLTKDTISVATESFYRDHLGHAHTARPCRGRATGRVMGAAMRALSRSGCAVS